MRVTSRVHINTARINQINQEVQTALEQTAEKLHTEVVQAQVIPQKDGHLQGEKFFVDKSKSAQGKIKLVFEGPYARRLYYHPEYNFSHTKNPNAKGKWLEDWLSGGRYQDFVRYKFEELLRRNGGF